MIAPRAFILLAPLFGAIFPASVVGGSPLWLEKVALHRPCPRSSFWGIKGGATPATPPVDGISVPVAAKEATVEEATVKEGAATPLQPPIGDPEKQSVVEQQAPVGPPESVLLDPYTLFLTDDDKAVYEQLEAAPSTDKLLSIAARIPAVRECPDYHLKITNAGRSDAFLAAYAVARLANTSTSEGEMESVISDRRFGQLIECISCQGDALSIVDISNTLFGFSVLKCVEDTLLRRLTQTAIKALSTSTLDDAVTLAWSCAHASALIGFSAEALFEHVAHRVLKEWHKVPAPDVSKLAWSMAVAGRGVDPLVHAIAHTATTNTSAFHIRELTHVAWSLSSLGYKNVTVRDAITSASLGRMAELPVEDLAKHARSLALWGSAVDTLLLELLICTEAKKADFDAAHTADVLWALGRANFRNASAFLARELPDVYQRMDAFSPQDLSKVLWSYATLLDVDDTVAPILSSLAGRASVILERVAGELEPVFLTQALWALATLDLHSQELCLRAAAVLEKRVSELSTSEVTNLAWALAKLGSPRNPVLDQVAALMEARHVDFTAKELCMCLWSLAVCGYKLRFHSPLQLGDDEALKELKPSEVSSLLWALAKVSTSAPPQPLMDVLCADVKRKLATFSPHDITQTAWALSMLEQRGHKVVTYVARAAQSWLKAFTAEQLATLTAALVHLNCPEQIALEGIKAEMERRLLCLLSTPPTAPPLLNPCGPALDMADRPSQNRALFHLCRCQQLLAVTMRDRDVRKSGRYRYEIGKRALSTLF